MIKNEPFLDDGTPMPTLYWLVGRPEREAVSRLEAAGGVREAEREADPEALSAAHARYSAERDAAARRLLEGHPCGDEPRPWPAGGVGGTRRGVKCLHAHLAWYLAGGDDPVGEWAAGRLGIAREGYVAGPAGLAERAGG